MTGGVEQYVWLVGLCILLFLGNILTRWLDYWRLVEYTEINNYTRNTSVDKLEQIFGERMAEKTGLLLYRCRTLIKKLEGFGFIADFDAKEIKYQISICERDLKRNPYNHRISLTDFLVQSIPDPKLAEIYYELRANLQEHSGCLEIYTRLFKIPVRSDYSSTTATISSIHF